MLRVTNNNKQNVAKNIIQDTHILTIHTVQQKFCHTIHLKCQKQLYLEKIQNHVTFPQKIRN